MCIDSRKWLLNVKITNREDPMHAKIMHDGGFTNYMKRLTRPPGELKGWSMWENPGVVYGSPEYIELISRLRIDRALKKRGH